MWVEMCIGMYVYMYLCTIKWELFIRVNIHMYIIVSWTVWIYSTVRARSHILAPTIQFSLTTLLSRERVCKFLVKTLLQIHSSEIIFWHLFCSLIHFKIYLHAYREIGRDTFILETGFWRRYSYRIDAEW